MARRVLVIDNYDSFTYILVQYLAMLGAECDVTRNDAVSAAELAIRGDLDGILLSPGPGRPEDAGITLDIIRALSGVVPLLGVCLGHQAIATCFGAVVQRARRPMHGKRSPILHRGVGVLDDLPSPFFAGRYHSLVVGEAPFPECLEATAWTEDGEIMALRHREHDVEGVQFHPESVLTEQGLKLMSNWLERL